MSNSITNKNLIKSKLHKKNSRNVKKMNKNKIKKHGAGFLFKSDNEVLLLLRSGKSKNSNTWGLPGGNLDSNESELEAAVRETTEEIGGCPPNFHVLGKIDILRGKNNQKLYNVYLAEISKNDKNQFKPQLNNEHIEYK